MKLDPRIWKELKRRAGKDRRAIAMWRAYVYFLESRPSLIKDTPDTAVHHILWRSEYNQHIKCKWNSVRLTHNDHAAAAALALGAEPNNSSLRSGFYATYKMAGNSSRWSPEDPNKVIHLYKTIRNSKKIGKILGIGQGAILSFLRRKGIPIHPMGRTNWTPRNPAEVIGLYKSGESASKIGRLFKVSHKTIIKFLKRKGISVLSFYDAHFKNPEEIIRSYKSGKTARDIGKQLKVSDETVIRFLKRNRVRLRTASERSFLRWKNK